MPRTYPGGLPRHTLSVGFGLSMTKLIKPKEFSVFRCPAPAIALVPALVLGLVPAIARAQVNIDQGKPAAEIFESDCGTCHKTARGLANGKNSLMLSSFLREHYTASRDQAAALAAYVIGAGGNAPAPSQKPGQEHAKATGEEPKTAEPKPGEPKPGEPKSAAHPPAGQASKPEAAPFTPAPVGAMPAAAVNPGSAEAPSQEGGPTTSAAAPAESQPGDNALVPRDNIPD
jgi:hypothetical protein